VPRRVRPATHVVGFISAAFSGMQDLPEKDLETKNYLDEKSGGVVYVALGTFGALEQGNFDELVAGLDNWTRLGENRGAVLALNEFGRSQMDVSNIPSSIRVEGWVDQKMILHHKNTKVFVTHAGLGSLSESIDAITPMLAFPLFGDQMANSYRLQEAGAALALHWREEPVQATKISDYLERLAADPSFVEATKRLYQISKREGGAKTAANIVEDMMMFGPPTYLVPSNDSVSFLASTNLDIYLVFLLGFAGLVFLGKKALVGGKKEKQKSE